MGGEHLRLLPSSGLPCLPASCAQGSGISPGPIRWYGGSKFHLTVGIEQVSFAYPQ